jgi:hypothetical protein
LFELFLNIPLIEEDKILLSFEVSLLAFIDVMYSLTYIFEMSYVPVN